MKKRKLFVGNLDYSTTTEQLRAFLASYGTVIGVRLMEGKGYAFVEMGSEEQAQKIQRTLSESIFNGRKLLIDGVPGTRRSEKKSKSSPKGSVERKPVQESGRKAEPLCRSDGKKSVKPEWKDLKFTDEPQRPARTKFPGTVYPIHSPSQQGQKTLKDTSQKSDERSKSVPVSKSSSDSTDIKKNITLPGSGLKAASSPLLKKKKSKVPVWVIQKKSAGMKNKKEKF